MKTFNLYQSLCVFFWFVFSIFFFVFVELNFDEFYVGFWFCLRFMIFCCVDPALIFLLEFSFMCVFLVFFFSLLFCVFLSFIWLKKVEFWWILCGVLMLFKVDVFVVCVCVFFWFFLEFNWIEKTWILMSCIWVFDFEFTVDVFWCVDPALISILELKVVVFFQLHQVLCVCVCVCFTFFFFVSFDWKDLNFDEFYMGFWFS